MAFRLRRSVGSLFRGWYGPVLISADILEWYVSVSRTTLAQPLSAGRTMIEVSSLSLLVCFSYPS